MPVAAGIPVKPEQPAVESLFRRRAASPDDAHLPVARNGIANSAPPVSTKAVQTQVSTPPARDSVRVSEKASPVAEQSGESPNERADIRRFLFEERVSQPERPRRAEVPVPSQASGPDSNSSRPPSAQKPTVPDSRESRAPLPQRIAGTKPLRSTTSFATSSLPMWHVSAPTAIPPVSSSPQSHEHAAPLAGAQPAPASPLTGNGKHAGIPGASDAAPAQVDSSSNAAKSDSSVGPEAARHSPPEPQHPLPAAPNRPSQNDAGRMWPKTAPATAAFGVSETKCSAEVETSVPENGDFAWQPAPPTPATKMNFAAPAQPAAPKHPAPSPLQNDLRAMASPPRPEQKSPLKWWPHSAESDGKHDIRNTLRSRIKQWLNPVTTPGNRRRAERRYVPGMVAHYFTGGAPKPQAIADISMTGLYLLTDERWMTGTMIQMTMQKPSKRGGKQSITVLSRIVRRGSDGVGAEFVMPESIDSRSHEIQPSQATDRLALSRFL